MKTAESERAGIGLPGSQAKGQRPGLGRGAFVSYAPRLARRSWASAGGPVFYSEQVPILTSSVRSSPRLTVTPRMNPTSGA